METNVQQTEDQPTSINHQPSGVSGLGGWLVLVQIGLILTILLALIQLPEFYFTVFDSENWNVFTSRESEYYHPLWGPTFIIETVFSTFLLGFTVFTLYMFYRKKFILPRLMIILYSANLFFWVVDLILLYQIPLAREVEDGSSIRELFQSIISCAIWIPYFLNSKRVKNTFVK